AEAEASAESLGERRGEFFEPVGKRRQPPLGAGGAAAAPALGDHPAHQPAVVALERGELGERRAQRQVLGASGPDSGDERVDEDRRGLPADAALRERENGLVVSVAALRDERLAENPYPPGKRQHVRRE